MANNILEDIWEDPEVVVVGYDEGIGFVPLFEPYVATYKLWAAAASYSMYEQLDIVRDFHKGLEHAFSRKTVLPEVG